MCSAGQQEIVSRSDMDTPEKTTQIANPLSKFEDSPVFNYINSLSPIKPVKSIHLTQTFNSLNFTSLPSIFTSPHVNSHKETRFLQRNSDPSKPGFLSENGNKIGSNDGIVENFDSGLSMEEVSADPSNDSNFSIELPRALTYDCGSPGCDPTRCCDLETSCVSKTGDTSISVVSSVKEASENGSSESELHLRGRKEIEGCDWESLISDAADLLIFNYPQHEFSVEAKMQMFETGDFSQQHVSVEGQSGQQETSEMKEIDQLRDNLAADDANICATGESSQIVDDEPVSNLHRGMRRRCLDFETVSRRKNLDNDSNSGSYMTLQSDEKVTPETMQMVNHKPINDSTRRILPGIGLHLNALAIASQESKLINSTASLHSQQTGQDSLSKSLTSASTERDMVSAEHGNSLEEDMPQMSPTLVSEEFNQGSPKKKRRKAENAGEGEGCKRCNCKKSKCLKLYCECFAAGVYCIEPCSCQDCFNKPIHEDTVLATRKQIESRNPLAFAPKVIRNTNSVPEYGDDSSKTPASARHKRGCNCKKSSCLKKYCECYQGGVGCSINCRCEGCKNTFGRKDGSTLMETVAAPGGGEETETQEKSEVNKDVHKTEILNNEELDPAATLPATPLRACRSLYQLPFSSKGKPPRTLLTIGSSSGFYTGGQKYGKPSILRAQPNSGKSLQLSEQDEVPEILRGQGSPVKGASPNSKRVSPPNSVLGSGSGSGSSPSRRSGRKLILQSIPSFPSLTPHH